MNKFDEIKLPNNIDNITDKAIDRGQRYMNNKKYKNKFLKVASLIVVIITVGVIGAANPAIASNIPIVGSVFEYLNYISDAKSTYSGGDQYKDEISVNKIVKDNGIEITIDGVSCDGSKVYVSYIIKGDEKIKESGSTMSLSLGYPSVKSDLSNTRLNINDIEGAYEDDYTFLGMQTIDLSKLKSDGIEISDNFKLDIVISEVMYASNKEIEIPWNIINGKWKFNLNVTKNTESTKKLTPNITINECTLTEVLLTNSSTQITYESSTPLPDGAMAEIKDNNGDIIGWIEGHDTIVNGITKYTWDFEKINKNATSLNIVIFDKNNDSENLAEFNIDIK